MVQQSQTGEEHLPESQDVAAPINVQLTPSADEAGAHVEDDDEGSKEGAVHVVRPTSLEEVMTRLAAKKASEGGNKEDKTEEENDSGEEEEVQYAAAAGADAQKEEGDAQSSDDGPGVEEAQGANESQDGNGDEEEEEADEGNVKEEGQEEERGEGGDDEEEEENAGPAVVRATRLPASKGYRAKPCFVQMITVSVYLSFSYSSIVCPSPPYHLKTSHVCAFNLLDDNSAAVLPFIDRKSVV